MNNAFTEQTSQLFDGIMSGEKLPSQLAEPMAFHTSRDSEKYLIISNLKNQTSKTQDMYVIHYRVINSK